jgi:hypothetical protein
VGGGTYSVPFITIPLTPVVEQLDITYFSAGIDGTAGCAGPATVGQTCTPSLPGASSPFNLQNIPDTTPGEGPISTNFSAGFGGSVDGSTDLWSGTFSGTVDNTSLQTLLGEAASGGAGTTYSGTFDVTVAVPSPEPSTLLFVFGGICVLFGCFRRKNSSQRANLSNSGR